ncbi:MAG: Hsp70 family protein, partial [Kofleriaceae bacterium]
PSVMVKLMMGAEAIKCHLSDNGEAEGEIEGLELPATKGSLPFHITRQQFEDLITGYVQRTFDVTRQVLVAAGLDVRAVSEVLCVGGSTRIPLVRERLADLFRKEPNVSINPDEVVSQGAAIQAGSLTRNISSGTGMGARDAVATTAHSTLDRGNLALPQRDAKRPVLLDVNPATLAIHTVGGYAERLLDKNAPIPIERTRVFTTSRDNQTRVEIECCRGEARRYSENEPIGALVLQDLPPKPRGDLKIEVSFRVDADGILHVRASDQASGARQEAHMQVFGAPVKEP